MGRRHNDVTDQQIIDLYKEVRSGNKVVQMLGVGDQTVYGVLRDNGIETTGLEEYRDRVRAFDDKAMEDVIGRYQSGENATQIAKHYGVTNGTVLVSLRKAGIEIRESKPPLSAEEKEEIVRLYKEGVSMKEIGKRLGRMEATIRNFLNKSHRDIVRPRFASGEQASGWKGGRFVHKGSGYVYVRIYEDDPFFGMANSNGYILEHRLVMARHLGRLLHKTESVHHIDRNKTHNDPDNLQLMHGQHGKDGAMRCFKCGSRNVGPAPIEH